MLLLLGLVANGWAAAPLAADADGAGHGDHCIPAHGDGPAEPCCGDADCGCPAMAGYLPASAPAGRSPATDVPFAPVVATYLSLLVPPESPPPMT